jgi:hypothetical protein
MTRYHTLGCPEAEITPDIMGDMARDGTIGHYAARPAADANGHTWRNQYGLPADMTQLLQAHAGERLLNLGGPFENGHGRMERLVPQRVTRFGEYDDPGDPGQEMAVHSQDMVRALAAQMGLASPTADDARERGRQRLEQAGRPRAAYRSWGDAMDRDPEVRQRAEQIRRGDDIRLPSGGLAEFSNTYADGSYDDGARLPGELARYTLG